MNRRGHLLLVGIFFCIGLVAVLAGTGIYLNARIPAITTPAERIQGSPTESPGTDQNSSTGTSGEDLILSVFDQSTGKPLETVSVYFDGGYEGATSAQGILRISGIRSVSDDRHTLRATKSGYMDYTGNIMAPPATPVKIGLQAQLLTPVQESGTHNSKIDIVFIPSKTSYNCAEQKKITPTLYVTDKSAFITDVNQVVRDSLFTLDSITDKTVPIPSDYRDRFNIYTYYDPSDFADAFNGCAGTVPEKVWKTASFADIVIILYPTYYTPATGAPCEPNACVNPGSGQSWMKIPADQKVLFLHESGHAVFGLIDTYCGDTEYWQNEPDPNVWSSQQSCVMYAKNNSWDPMACRQILIKNPVACTKPFWRWDADLDIMHEGFSGTFGKASTRRITYIFNNINTWGIPA